ncbi:hypothetical protein DPMN_141547 [Dreissena polymorpha]|uniref:Uncharacterized protein n=1 Tax=Dreissena polymorpha TaxID=45954 RepID=A0A9D4JMP4_DREPO|nr:hypothetical protein DPMN_141547 [Dreissena polymorpha]
MVMNREQRVRVTRLKERLAIARHRFNIVVAAMVAEQPKRGLFASKARVVSRTMYKSQAVIQISEE